MTDDVTLPETEAGRKLLGWLQFASRRADGVPKGNTIVAIEAEARAPLEATVATLREALQVLPDLAPEHEIGDYIHLEVADVIAIQELLATPSTDILARIKAETVAELMLTMADAAADMGSELDQYRYWYDEHRRLLGALLLHSEQVHSCDHTDQMREEAFMPHVESEHAALLTENQP